MVRRIDRLSIILSISASSGLLANDLFLPLLPAIKNLFGVGIVDTQFLLIHFLFVMGLSQLAYPLLTSVLGRKGALYLGLFVFGAASLFLVMAATFQQLILLRTFQAFGAGMCLALSRVILRSQMSQDEAQRGFVMMATIMGVMPGIAPLLGFTLNEGFDLKACFVAGTVFSFSTGALISTLKLIGVEKKAADNQTVKSYFVEYKKVVASRVFWRYAIIPCFAYAVYFSYVCISPYFLELGGLNVTAVAASYMVLSFTYVIGSFIAREFVARHGVDAGLFLGHVIFLVGGIWTGVELMSSPTSPLQCVLAMSLLTLGNGFLLPLGTAATLSTNSNNPALLPAVLGFFQFCVAASCAYLASILMSHDIGMVGVLVVLISVAAFSLSLRDRYFGKLRRKAAMSA